MRVAWPSGPKCLQHSSARLTQVDLCTTSRSDDQHTDGTRGVLSPRWLPRQAVLCQNKTVRRLMGLWTGCVHGLQRALREPPTVS